MDNTEPFSVWKYLIALLRREKLNFLCVSAERCRELCVGRAHNKCFWKHPSWCVQKQKRGSWRELKSWGVSEVESKFKQRVCTCKKLFVSLTLIWKAFFPSESMTYLLFFLQLKLSRAGCQLLLCVVPSS